MKGNIFDKQKDSPVKKQNVSGFSYANQHKNPVRMI